MPELTCFMTIEIPKNLSVRLRFGCPVDHQAGGNGATQYWFAPGQIFGCQWWARLSPRKHWACFAVVESLASSNVGYRVPNINPAVRIHAWLSGPCRHLDCGAVTQADSLIDQIESEHIDPSCVAAAYFRAAGQALRVGRRPRHLTHAHWQQFRRIQTCA